MSIINEKLPDAIEGFINTVIGPGKIDNLSIQDDLSIKTAVKMAYNDAKRTMTGLGKKGNKKKAEKKEDALKDIAEAFNKYFKKRPPCDRDNFNNIHNNICQIWCKAFPDDDPLGVFGKAQKIVNMTFKYLYCCSDADNYKDYFNYCHMPLDSYTLEWVKREILEKSKSKSAHLSESGKIDSWSNLEYGEGHNHLYEKEGKTYYSYCFYIESIQEYIDKNKLKCSPLELEFVEWPEIRNKMAAEDFYFSLKEKLDTKAKKAFRQKSYKDQLLLIKSNLELTISQI